MSHVSRKNPNEFVLLILDKEVPVDPLLELILSAHGNKEIKIVYDKPARTYNHREADASINLICNNFPDLIILGHNHGAGFERAKVMPQGYIANTLVVMFTPKLEVQQQYEKLGFKHFCDRNRIAEYMKQNSMIKTLQRLRRLKLRSYLKAGRQYTSRKRDVEKMQNAPGSQVNLVA